MTRGRIQKGVGWSELQTLLQKKGRASRVIDRWLSFEKTVAP